MAGAPLKRCRQHVSSFLLRQAIWYAGAPWTKKHRAWLGALKFEALAHRLMLAEMLETLDQTQARRDRLIEHIRELVPSWLLPWLVEALQALRGFDLVMHTAMGRNASRPIISKRRHRACTHAPGARPCR